jgi:beta-glucanase (GH16 family)
MEHEWMRIWLPLWLLGCTAGNKDEDAATQPTDSSPPKDSGQHHSDADDTSRPADTAPPDDTAGPADTASPPPDAPNLLVDPGFEEDDSAWSIWGGAERVAGHSRSGTWAVMATATNGAEQVVTGLEPNTTYRLSGWGKNTGTTPLLIGVKDYGGEEMRALFTEPTYTEGTLSFTTGFANTAATVYAYKHAEPEPAYADDLVLQREGPSDLTLVWSDEFDGTGPLDDTKWTAEEGFVRNHEVQWYQAENAFQEDGLLVIEGRAEERPNPDYVPGSTDWRTSRETITHTSASVTTKDRFSWQYGHLVVRAKVTNLPGTWPAIWTLGVDCEWPSNGEVDVMENYGGDILANFAWGTDVRWTPSWDSSHWPVSGFGSGWTEEFHIWEWEWTADRMVIKLDGAVLNDASLSSTINGSAACEGENPFQQPHRLLLNLALGGSAGGSIEGLAFPTRYLVDYVRIYQ